MCDRLLLLVVYGAGAFFEDSGNVEKDDVDVGNLVAQGMKTARQSLAQGTKLRECLTGRCSKSGDSDGTGCNGERVHCAL